MPVNKQTDSQVSWSNVFFNRDLIHKQYNSIWRVPVLRKRFALVKSLMNDGARVLDVGAGNSEWGQRLQKAYANITFKTVDIDPKLNPDYRSMHEIPNRFDLIISWEVIEHLNLEEGENLIKECTRVLCPGGNLVINTPNIFNPSCYLTDIYAPYSI